jgi:FKBP-type peptidyl-prolyl cis-trans isomerase
MSILPHYKIVQNTRSKPKTKMAKFIHTALLLIIALAVIGMATSFSMTMSSSNADVDRRSFVNKGTAAAAVAVTGGLLNNPSKSIAAETDTAAAEADVAAAPEVDADGFFTTDSGMKYKVTKEGIGGIPTNGQTVKVS